MTITLPFSSQQRYYQTDLTPEQISQRLVENVITGFSFYSPKPYYGQLSLYSFSVRKTGGNFKKESLSPTVEGSYNRVNDKTIVWLSVRPHPGVLIALGVFSFPIGLFLIASLGAFFSSWSLTDLFNSFFPVIILYGVFWLIFQTQRTAALQFWTYTLALHENQA